MFENNNGLIKLEKLSKLSQKGVSVPNLNKVFTTLRPLKCRHDVSLYCIVAVKYNA